MPRSFTRCGHRRSRSSCRPVEFLEARRLLSAGELDPTFGNAGKVLTDMPGSASEQGWSVAVQDDGKVVAAGTLARQGDLYGDFLVARYRTDGTLDPTFGGGDGFTAIDFDARHDVARSVRLVGDKIIVGGYSAAQITPGTTTSNPRESGLDFAVARLNSDGSPDTAFDGDGHRLIDFGAADAAANDMAVLPTGQVYLVGTSAAAPYALAALKSDGSLDPAFDGDGLLLTQFDRDIRVATSVEADSNGRLVVAGNLFGGFIGTPNVSVARFLPNGQLDPSFGGGGTGAIRIPLGTTPTTVVGDLALAPDGKILLAGSGVARLQPDGALDTTFRADGRALLDFIASSVVVDADSSVLVVGSDASAQNTPALTRFLPNGSVDPVFNGGVAGAQRVINGRGWSWDVALAPGGKSVTVGAVPLGGASADPLTAPDLAVTRRMHDGTLDPSFAAGGTDGDGVAVTDFVGPSFDAVSDLLTLDDSGVLAVGAHWTGHGTGYNFALVRYSAGGSLDPAFGTGGIVFTDYQNQADLPTSVALEADGKILVAGRSNNDVLVARYNADGSVDASFGEGGQVVMAAVEGRAFAPTRASDPTANLPPVLLTVREDGRVVLATTVGANVSDYHFALAQLTPAGLPDLTFGGGDGFVVTTRFTAGASSVALAPGGKIVVAGNRGGVGSTGTVYLARYTAAGAPDEIAFTSAGYVTVSSTGTGPVVAVAPDGAITVGMTTPAGAAPGADFLLYRVLSDGQPDRTFTGDGRADFGGADDTLRDIVLLADGSVVAVGGSPMAATVDRRSAGDFAVAKFTPTGAPDAAFGAADGTPDGKLRIDFAGLGDAAQAVALDGQGRIVVAGGAFVPRRSSDFALARLEGIGTRAVPVLSASMASSTWTAAFRSALEAGGVGDDGGFLLTRTSAASVLPWVNLDQVIVHFGAAVDDYFDSRDLRVRGVNVASYPVSDFTYDPASRTGTFTLGQPVANDRIVVELFADQAPGPDYAWRASVLAGDATGDGGVSATDLAYLKQRFNRSLSSPGIGNGAYSLFADVTGDGRVNALDLSAVKQRLNRRLPGGTPAVLEDGSVTKDLLGLAPIL